MNRREGAIITAHTGMLVGSFDDAHKYMQQIMGRPLYTHELASKVVMEEIKDKSREDFLILVEEMAD